MLHNSFKCLQHCSLYKKIFRRKFSWALCESMLQVPIKLKHSSFNEHVVRAVDELNAGHIIALPTDTLYGIAALAQNQEAINQIYKVKRRCELKPLALCVSSVDQIYEWAEVTVSKQLLFDILPGPVTLLFKRTSKLNRELNPDTPLVALRIPNSKFIVEVARQCNSPLALTSANISSQLSPLSVSEFEEIWQNLSAVFDGGFINQGSCDSMREGSTIIDLSTEGCYKILRDGVALKSSTLILSKYNLKALN